MRELRDIIAAYFAAQATGQTAGLATVVGVSGSTYRRPGARMLVTEDGRVTGCVSGGCLERSVFDHARRALATGDARVVRYDSTADDDITWGFGLGCDGAVDVLIEPLHGQTPDSLAFVADCYERRVDGAIATVSGVEGDAGTRVGDRLVMRSGDGPIGRLAVARLHEAACAAMDRVLTTGNMSMAVESPDARVVFFVEHIAPPLPLLIFGAGHDSLPLVRLARELGWHTTLIDYRPASLARARLSGADRVVSCRPGQWPECVADTPRAAAIVMNHHFPDDRATLGALLRSSVNYIGVLGPRQRTDRLLAELHDSGVASQHARIHAPIGLDIGADNPEEIALAILAEITATFRNHPGGSLRDRTGPLHNRLNRLPKSADRNTPDEIACAVIKTA